MATMEQAAAIVAGLPGVTEGERFHRRTWFVGGKAFAWERPFSKADLKRFGATEPPQGPILAVTVEDLGDKEAVLAAHPVGVFTIAHFDNYPAVLVQLSEIPDGVLQEVLVDAWLVHAPGDLADHYLGRD